jgi:hypothetical protein
MEATGDPKKPKFKKDTSAMRSGYVPNDYPHV